MKIYLAGPLFTIAERYFNKQLAEALIKVGFDVFLPQEIEVRTDKNISFEDGIFKSDVQGIDSSDIVLACMDGPDPDSGTCWECGYAYAKEKPIFTYRTDFRGAGDAGGSKFNLMMWCSSVFTETTSVFVTDQYSIVNQIAEKLKIILEKKIIGKI
jgi:nucleoside 2-deoxyribosyltransferase